MTSEARVIDVPGLPTIEIAPHHCFACGTLNAGGMHLDLHVERARSWTELTYEARFQGWDGLAHGGILATVLDEVMAWALVGEDHWGLTARMGLEFKRPVRVDQHIRAEGTITRRRKRLIETEGRIVDADTGELLATATGLYLAADEARKQELRERYGWRIRDRVDGVDGPDTPRVVDPTR